MISRKHGLFSILALLVAVLALLAAGCGGDDDDEAGDGGATTAAAGGGGGVEALPSSSCTAVEYEGEGEFEGDAYVLFGRGQSDDFSLHTVGSKPGRDRATTGAHIAFKAPSEKFSNWLQMPRSSTAPRRSSRPRHSRPRNRSCKPIQM